MFEWLKMIMTAIDSSFINMNLSNINVSLNLYVQVFNKDRDSEGNEDDASLSIGLVNLFCF